ncbi:hypothetical protein V6U90_10480 [Micromonospora sp. CPCC 206060]|uniref:hypothetical protein n=1 Tax=Micromonospora sp. CPCC 206060 TaxID=3122406 RepID=UPI002FEEB145
MNIGIKGRGNNVPAAFDGAQVITGKFHWSGWEDVLVYYPDGVNAGAGTVISGEGDGSVLQTQLSANTNRIDPQGLQDPYGNSPLRLANGYDADGVEPLAPDLISVTGDPVNGYGLTYHPSMPLNGVYYGNYRLTVTTPTGGTDWQNWAIASTRVASGVALFLRNQATGALYLWQGVTVADNGDGTGTVTRTQFEIAANWRTGESLTALQATDINGDGVPDLWTVTPDGTATAYLISGLNAGGTATVQAQPAQTLN